MIITLSHEEMLSQWKLRRLLEPLRSDCAVQRSDGIDLDRFLALEMRDWYLNLLDTAPLNLLPITDISGDVALKTPDYDNGCAIIALPERCRRIVSVMLETWLRPATIATPDSAIARCQDSPYSRAGICCPVAILDNLTLRLYGGIDLANPPAISSLKAVVVPPDGVYMLDECALSLITKID